MGGEGANYWYTANSKWLPCNSDFQGTTVLWHNEGQAYVCCQYFNASNTAGSYNWVKAEKGHSNNINVQIYKVFKKTHFWDKNPSYFGQYKCACNKPQKRGYGFWLYDSDASTKMIWRDVGKGATSRRKAKKKWSRTTCVANTYCIWC